MKRRQFFKNSLPLIAIPHLVNGIDPISICEDMPTSASNSLDNDKVLVYVNLNGGVDLVDMLLPLDSIEFLKSKRPNVLFSENEYLSLDCNEFYALHPSLAPFKSLLDANKLEIIPAFGSKEFDGSHNAALRRSALLFNNESWLQRFAQSFVSSHHSDPIIHAVGNRNAHLGEISNSEFTELNATSLKSQFEFVLNTLRKGTSTKIFLLKMHGFDTHENQKELGAELYAELANACFDFQSELEKSGLEDRVSTFLYSELGRNLEENACKGTEHGAGSIAFLMGNNCKNRIWNYKPQFEKNEAEVLYTFEEILPNILHGSLSLSIEISKKIISPQILV